jgi:hypothetical protein
LTSTGKLQFTRTDNTGARKKALSSDLEFVATYNHDLDEWEYVEKAAARNAGTYTMNVTAFSGKTVQSYVGVFTAEKKMYPSACLQARSTFYNDRNIYIDPRG